MSAISSTFSSPVFKLGKRSQASQDTLGSLNPSSQDRYVCQGIENSRKRTFSLVFYCTYLSTFYSRSIVREALKLGRSPTCSPEKKVPKEAPISCSQPAHSQPRYFTLLATVSTDCIVFLVLQLFLLAALVGESFFFATFRQMLLRTNRHRWI